MGKQASRETKGGMRGDREEANGETGEQGDKRGHARRQGGSTCISHSHVSIHGSCLSHFIHLYRELPTTQKNSEKRVLPRFRDQK